MDIEKKNPASHASNRLLSLDFMRGLIMCLLALEACGFYYHLRTTSPEGSLGQTLISQFFHAGWHGLHFWDLIQPAFMFMAGIAMTYSLTSQINRGYSWNQRLVKLLKRCGWLVFWGIFKRISSPDWLAWEALDVTDILTQLAFASLIAFFVFGLTWRYQLLACAVILLTTELLYRGWPVSGFDEPFTQGANFGNWVDAVLFGQPANTYVFINWFPTAVHTVAGVLVGKLLLNQQRPTGLLLLFGLPLIILGYSLDSLALTPIIKPIASSSFMLASLGFCLWMIAVLHWWIDVRNHKKGLLFLQVLGMNAIFIYLFFDIVGRNWLNDYGYMITSPLLASLGLSATGIAIASSLCVFALEWSICYFLYRKKIFFKL